VRCFKEAQAPNVFCEELVLPVRLLMAHRCHNNMFDKTEEKQFLLLVIYTT
jgi:hypothetical protein